jgi:hypothetical protein
MPSTQTRRKRKFGQLLARLRDRSHLTTEEAGRLIRRNQSQISKIENGHILCAYAELTALLTQYNATDDERDEAEALWDDAKQDSTRIDFSSAVPPKFRTFLRNEADAAKVRELAPGVIPGLLQTAEYAAAIRIAAHRIVNPSVGDEKAVAARLGRQKLLAGDDPLRMHALIDEAVLHRVVGNQAIMTKQLRHLVKMAGQDNIIIQVIRYEHGAYGTMSGPFTILGFDDPEDPDVVYLEYPGGGQWVDNKDDVRKFVQSFKDISDQAARAHESAMLIRELAGDLEGR